MASPVQRCFGDSLLVDTARRYRVASDRVAGGLASAADSDSWKAAAQTTSAWPRQPQLLRSLLAVSNFRACSTPQNRSRRS